MKEVPLVCNLTSSERDDRRGELLSGLLSEARKETRLPDGFRWTFGPQVLRSVLQVIEAERQCCRFLGFVLTVEAPSGRITLDVTGPPGTVEFLTAMIQQNRGDGSRLDAAATDSSDADGCGDAAPSHPPREEEL